MTSEREANERAMLNGSDVTVPIITLASGTGTRTTAGVVEASRCSTKSSSTMPESPSCTDIRNFKSQRTRRQSISAENYDPSDDAELGDEIKEVYPKSDEQRVKLFENIEHILLFRNLDEEQRASLMDAMFRRNVEAGEHVIKEGDDGDFFYVIESGTFDAYHKNNRTAIFTYDNQGSFGELALMYNVPRAATIIARTDGALWVMSRVTFRRIVLKNAYNKRKRYETLLGSVSFLKSLNKYERIKIADALFSNEYEDGQVILKQGDSADCMYFVESGEVKICMRKTPDSSEVQISRKKVGTYFGELALVTNKPRAATAYAVGHTKVAVMDVEGFERLLGPCMDVLKRNVQEYEKELSVIYGSDKPISSDIK